MQKSQSNAARVSTPANKLISQSETHPDLITAISLQRVNTKFSLHLCRLCLWGMSSHGSSSVFVGLCVCVGVCERGKRSETVSLTVLFTDQRRRELQVGKKQDYFQLFHFNYSDGFELLPFTKISPALVTFGLPPVALCCSLHCAFFACPCHFNSSCLACCLSLHSIMARFPYEHVSSWPKDWCVPGFGRTSNGPLSQKARTTGSRHDELLQVHHWKARGRTNSTAWQHIRLSVKQMSP